MVAEPRVRRFTPPPPEQVAALEHEADRARRERVEAAAALETAKRQAPLAGPARRDVDAAVACACSCHPRPADPAVHEGGVRCHCQLTPAERAATRRELFASVDAARDDAAEAAATACFAAAASELDVRAVVAVGGAPFVITGTCDGRGFYLRERHGSWRVTNAPDEDPTADPWTMDIERPTVDIAAGSDADLCEDDGSFSPEQVLRVAVRAVREALLRNTCEHEEPVDAAHCFCRRGGVPLADADRWRWHAQVGGAGRRGARATPSRECADGRVAAARMDVVATAKTARGRAGSRPEQVRLRIGNLAKAVLVTGQAYQDPKDALNEFVSNAADEYTEAGRPGERIRVVLRRKGQRPMIAVDDFGRGMSPDRLRELARNLFESAKAGDDRTLGEKAIGMLAFQQLGGRLEVVSRAHDSAETWCLRLSRGSAMAELERERRRPRTAAGTTVYLSDLDPDVLRVLTQRKVVDYLRVRRSAALARGDYVIEVIEGRAVELVTPDKPDGVRLEVPARSTLWGRIEFALYVAPKDGKRRRVAVVGRAGTTIIDDVCELDELAHAPWDSDQVQGQVIFAGLQQSAGRRAVLRDRDAFPLFVDALQTIEPAVTRAAERMMAELDAQTTDRMADTIRRLFSRVLKELADLDNPMRSTVNGTGPDGGRAEPAPADDEDIGLFDPPAPAPATTKVSDDPATWAPPRIDDVFPDARSPIRRPPAPEGTDRERGRTSDLPSVQPDPAPTERRSRFDPVERVVLYNDHHSDYLLVKDDEPALLDYLTTLVAKEYVLYNNPRAHADDLAEEMVRMMIRVRRHLPRKR